MSARAAPGAQPGSPLRVIVIGAIGGTIAGMMMAMLEMLYGWGSSSHSFWDPPMAIWSWLAGIDNFGAPGDHVVAIVLGLVLHMINSMMVGVVFAALLFYVVRARDDITPIVLGVAYGLGIWVGMRYLVLPLNPGEDDLFTRDLVSPQWLWWVSHAVLGMTAGLYYDVVRRFGGPAIRKVAVRQPSAA